MNHRDLVMLTKNYESTIEWLMTNNYIPSYALCSSCDDKEMKLENNKNIKRWRCSKCGQVSSIFKNTILENLKISLSNIIDLIYFWSIDLTQNKSAFETDNICRDTVSKWYHKLSLQTFF
ncbi:hypothetical protein H311_00637, partial [Anncaliia algerae PRA109]